MENKLEKRELNREPIRKLLQESGKSDDPNQTMDDAFGCTTSCQIHDIQ